jgi:hypothetical protein
MRPRTVPVFASKSHLRESFPESPARIQRPFDETLSDSIAYGARQRVLRSTCSSDAARGRGSTKNAHRTIDHDR